MTREEIIRNLKYTMEKHKNDTVNTFDTNISAMCKDILDYLEQEPCEDCISRREAIKMFTYNYKGERIPDYDCDNFPVQIAIKTVKEMLRELPSVNPQPKTGYWIVHEKPNGIRYLECSCCNIWYLNEHLLRNSYCPNCGAKMVEPQESEE